MDVFLIIYAICVFVVTGFQLAKADSIFTDCDTTFVVGAVFSVLIAPVTLCLIVGHRLYEWN